MSSDDTTTPSTESGRPVEVPTPATATETHSPSAPETPVLAAEPKLTPATNDTESEPRAEAKRPSRDDESGDARPRGVTNGRGNDDRPDHGNGDADRESDDREPTERADAPVRLDADGNPIPRKRRRRGSRGGRNRRKKPSDASASRTPESSHGDENEAESWNEAAADRGITTDDVAAVAIEEAGLARPSVPKAPPAANGNDTMPRPTAPPPRPRIGDSRPAPSDAASSTDSPKAEGEGAPKRRRRRGGRGRGKGGQNREGQETAAREQGGRGQGGRGQGRGQSKQTVTPVTANLGLDEAIDLDDLDEETLERRRGRTRKGRATGRYTVCISTNGGGPPQIALLEGRALTEHYVSGPADDTTSIDGNIYLGKVQNVLPGMEAAFVDIGTPKNGVIYRSDVTFDPSDTDGEQKKRDRPRIEQMLRNGQNVLVQVTKNPIAHKGARLTMEVSLAGRFVVMVPNQPDTYGISKRLPDDERKRLRKVLDRLRPADAGLIVRTAAEGATEEELERDMLRLNEQWRQISELAKRSKGGTLLYKEPPLAVRVIREEFNKEYRQVLIDDRALYEEVRAYVEAVAPELAERVEFYDDPLPLFERFHVHEQLVKALDRKVWLPSGGSLIIERTEALTVIDVNTGKNVGKSNLEETVFRNNLEAAEEVARQLRLRDIGGIIVIDFIDMEIKENQAEVVRVFREALARDKTRTQVFDISELGLVEMTRKRISEGLVESFSHVCEACHGRGIIIEDTHLGGGPIVDLTAVTNT